MKQFMIERKSLTLPALIVLFIILLLVLGNRLSGKMDKEFSYINGSSNGENFFIEGSLGASRETKDIVLVMIGKYGKIKVSERFPIVKDCPIFDSTIKRKNNVLSYKIPETMKTSIPKEKTDQCIMSYVDVLDKHMAIKIKTYSTYQ